MRKSLSLVLTVNNGESRLARVIHRLLETLPELTHEFEVLIIDDGSNDETITVARELARRYPQVRALRRPLPQGAASATQFGLRHTSGEIVMIQDSPEPVSPCELDYLWRLRNDQRLVMVQPAAPAGMKGKGIRRGGLRMLRRRAIERLANCSEPEDYLQVQPIRRHDPPDGRTPAQARPQYLIRLKPTMPLGDLTTVAGSVVP